MIRRRRRGTAIVETEKGILVVGGKRKIFLLPGGGANKGETRTKAAMRELHEETGMHPISAKFLFRYVGHKHKAHGGGFFRDYHTVVLVKAEGTPRPKHEVKHIAWYKPGSNIKLSHTTKKIIEKFLMEKK